MTQPLNSRLACCHMSSFLHLQPPDQFPPSVLGFYLPLSLAAAALHLSSITFSVMVLHAFDRISMHPVNQLYHFAAQNFCIVIEMFVATLAHRRYFSFKVRALSVRIQPASGDCFPCWNRTLWPFL